MVPGLAPSASSAPQVSDRLLLFPLLLCQDGQPACCFWSTAVPALGVHWARAASCTAATPQRRGFRKGVRASEDVRVTRRRGHDTARPSGQRCPPVGRFFGYSWFISSWLTSNTLLVKAGNLFAFISHIESRMFWLRESAKQNRRRGPAVSERGLSESDAEVF